MNFADLNARMCEFALARLDAMGEEASGLYNYYAYLARKGTMLRPEEIAVAEYIDRVVPKHQLILELCAGAAQLGHLLSLMGHSVFAVEIDGPRCELAIALGDYLGSGCTVLRGSWQGLRLADWHLLVTLNAVTSHVSAVDAYWLSDHAMRGGEFIIRPRQFGVGVDVRFPGLKMTEVFDDVYHYRAA